MNFQFDEQFLQKVTAQIQSWLSTDVLIWKNLVQLVMLLIFVLVGMLSRRMQPYLKAKLTPWVKGQKQLRALVEEFLEQLASISIILLLWISILFADQLGRSVPFLGLCVTLLTAWVLIKILTTVMLDRFWAKTVTMLAWSLAALSILNILGPMLEFLDLHGFKLGGHLISILALIKAGILLLVTLKLGGWSATYVEKQMIKIPQLSPSAHVLFGKALRVTIYFIVTLVVLESIGVDLTAITVFGGAVGVGIGFGLQKVTSNLLSGIILLTDGSIKPGDVVQIGDVYGWISGLRSRYVSVVTRDGHEYLIPNEDLITQQVINWSYSDSRIRLKIPFGIAYDSDPHQVQELLVSAVKKIPRVLPVPEPMCFLTGFGDSSLDMEMRIWIDDPKNGVGNIKSAVLLKVWDVLKEHNITIPFPQRDVHIHGQQLPHPKATGEADEGAVS